MCNFKTKKLTLFPSSCFSLSLPLSAICPPTSLAGVTACDTNDLTITWDQNPETGVTYFLYSQKEGGANTSYSTVDTSYVISGLQCGEHYSFRVTAKDSVCTSNLSSTMEMDTGTNHRQGLFTTYSQIITLKQ